MRLTKLTFPFILSLILFVVSCKATKLDTVNVAQDNPTVRQVVVYKIYPSDAEGTLLEKRLYNEKGQITHFYAYDYYGSGEIEDSTTYTYNEQGKKSKQLAHGSSTTTTYQYDDLGRLKEESWSRPNGQGSQSIFSYNGSGDLVEIKYFDANGTYDFSRTFEYGYDRKGRVISEKKWEKYSDGAADMMMYHFEYEYSKDDSLIVKARLNKEGKIDRKTEYKYDNAGRLTHEIEISFANGKEEEREKTVYHLNELGQVTKDESITIYDGKERLNYTNSYKYNKYGHQIWMMYEHSDGTDAWGERSVYSYY